MSIGSSKSPAGECKPLRWEAWDARFKSPLIAVMSAKEKPRSVGQGLAMESCLDSIRVVKHVANGCLGPEVLVRPLIGAVGSSSPGVSRPWSLGSGNCWPW